MVIYQNFFDLLDVPYIITRRPAWDKFPGADYTLAFDTLMPDGRTMQIGTIHLLGESFARTFDIKYEDKDGSLQYVNQTCYGISERCVASVISIHGDEHGLVLPPKVAPIQVVIVPIVFSSQEGGGEVNKACAAVYEELEKAGIRAFLDDSEERPGAKYYRWEMKGVPLRIEIGPRDLRNNSCVFVRRDDSTKAQVPLRDAIQEAKRTLEEIQSCIQERASKTLLANIYESDGNDAGSEEEMITLKKKAEQGIVSLFLCDSERCGKDLEERLEASVLGEPISELQEKSEGKCIICSSKARRVYVARAY
jgi:prolyl-tRNA synthetase